MRVLLAILACAALAQAAIDGVVTNTTTGKPQAGSTVTLFQPSQQGPQFIDSVKTDAQGHFSITKEVPGGGAGPLLLQAVYGGVQYNKMLPPGTPTTGVEIPVSESTKNPGAAKIDQHMILLEPSSDGNVTVSESYIFKNDGKTTFNDPDNGTLQFALPAAAQGKVEVNATAPGGLPIRKAPDPGPKPNTFKLDLPIKPGETRIDMQWAMPFRSPGPFEYKLISKDQATRFVSPASVTFKGGGLKDLGQEPNSKAHIYDASGPDVKFEVEGTGALNDSAASGGGQSSEDGGGNQQQLTENLPKLYSLAMGNSDLLTSVMAVKWVLLSALGMLALGFAILYRKGNPLPSGSEAPAPKASKKAKG
jgi:hypothetical protein